MLSLSTQPDRITVLHARRAVGEYALADAFKPHLHPLCTPRGHVLTDAMPHDHRHHKGVMLAFATDRGNFWEETPSPVHEKVGRQVHRAFRHLISGGAEDGGVMWTHELDWVVDGELLFKETRTLACRFNGSYVWDWSSQLTAQRDLTLIQSVWAHPHGERWINYHGLGVRLRRDFGGLTGGHELHLDGQRFPHEDFAQAIGTVATEVTYTGSLDATLPVERASVTLRQTHPARFGWYVRNREFPFVSTGPSWQAPVPLRRDETLDLAFTLTLADR